MAPRLVLAAAWLSIISTSLAQSVIPEMSFGQSGNLAPDGQKIPGWTVSTTGHAAQILSDRLALTPVHPGNTRGAIWADSPVSTEQWTAELEFRASGQEQASGNMVLWYVQDKQAVAQNSVYTVGKFDGMGIVIDQYGGRGGSVRGFLNDGGQNFAGMSSLESLAFGHCDYSYRNLGRPSKLRVSSSSGLSVFVEDKLCFQSEQITLPAGYFLGVTAATAENPDAIEVFKFTTLGSSTGYQTQPQQGSQQSSQGSSFPGAPEALPDRMADEIRSNDAQFEDLHNRLQSLQHQIADMNAQFDSISRKLDERANQIIGGMPSIPQEVLARLNQRVENTERIVQIIQRDLEGRDYKQHFSELQEAMANVRGGLTEALPESLGKIVTASAPRMGFFLFIVIAVQVLLAGLYVLYKRRRASAPKKYL